MTTDHSNAAQEEQDLTYWRHRTPIGVKIEEISGGARYSSARLWELMARQVWSENGRDGDYRAIDHAENGAPLLQDSDERISVSHTRGMFVVATLPPTPEADLEQFSLRTAMGVDTERCGRTVNDAVRQRVFSAKEQELIPADKSLLGWVCKEALYKAVLGGANSWTDDYSILRLPDPDKETTGEAEVTLPSGKEPFILYAWRSGDFIIAIAISPRCATYKKTTTDGKKSTTANKSGR